MKPHYCSIPAEVISFQGLVHFWFLITCLVCKSGGRRPGESYYVIRSIAVICHHSPLNVHCHVQDQSHILY